MFRSKNKLHLVYVLLLTLTLLSACSQQTNETTTNSNSLGNAPASTVPAEASTREYSDSLDRKVTIPTHPERVIVLQYLPEMIALGMKPAGAATHLLNNLASTKDQVADVEDIGASNEPNLEKILSLKPDLIIAAEWNQEKLEELNKIAPTVVVKWEGTDAFQHFRDIADVLGQKEKAEEWVQAFTKKTEETKIKLAPYVKEGETFGVVVIGGYENGQLRVYGNGNVGYILFDALKFPMTDTVKTEWDKGNNEQGLNISLEKLPEFASADRLFLVTFDNDPDFVKQIDNSSLWKNLPAVKNNKVYSVDSDLWFSYDVLSFDAQLDDAVTLLSKN